LLARLDAAELRSDSLDLPFLVAHAFPDRTGWRIASRQPVTLVSVRATPRLLLPVASAGEGELWLRARAREGRTFELALSLGGRPLGRLELGQAPVEARLRVQAGVLSPGDGALFFAPSDPQATFELQALQLRPPAGAARTPERRDGALVLPPGSSAEFPLDRGEGSLLLAAGPLGQPAARCRVSIETDSASFAVDERELRSASDLELPLPASAGPAALRVASSGPASLRVTGLRLRSRRPPPAATATNASPAVTPRGQPSIVVFVTDALRADALGAYGSPVPASPRFDAFAREAVLFETAWAQAPWTRSAVASLFTGLFEARHGVTGWKSDLDAGLPTLAEGLRDAGYRTAGFCANPLVQPARGFAQGFDHWRAPAARMGDAPAARVLVEEALGWLDAAAETPSFVYVHALEPHTPYRAAPEHWRAVAGGEPPPARRLDAIPSLPEPSQEDRALVRSAYMAEVRQSDAAFGALLDGLQARGRLDASVVVFLADHGEELWDHGAHGHVRTLYDEMLRIPLAVRLPGGAHGGSRRAGPASQVDVLPTLLRLAGGAAPAGLDGRDLGPELAGAGTAAPTLRADTRVPPHAKRAVRQGSLKLIVNDDDERHWRAGARVELYDIVADPGERANLASRRRVTARHLEALLRDSDARARAGPGTERALSESEHEGLRALGYVQ
jgi:arylsulfatase A-like enzyme